MSMKLQLGNFITVQGWTQNKLLPITFLLKNNMRITEIK